ncbi:MAG TPA: hypothetical protein VFP58_09305 [Candidatus Eisenbacteria bacterium]|nr:hypothetical protein [Candidatus Eisenbacteria bacterium]
MELIEIEGAAPTLLMVPPGDARPDVTLFATWHAESRPVLPAALEGAERVALMAAVGAISGLSMGDSGVPAAMVVAPGASHGSLVLERVLRDHRASLQAPVAFWPRIGPRSPRRRRVFLGARGLVVLAVRGETNPYDLRDRIVAHLSRDAFGPRPLDFELLRKVARSESEMEFLEETLDEPASVAGEGEDRVRAALFEPRGSVSRPSIRHPDRPASWITIEIAEDMDPQAVADLARVEAPGIPIDLVEGFPWDRHNIHHPAVQAAIRTAKHRSEGAEIWPMAPWVTPSGVFTRALGTPLVEWSVPLPSGTPVRNPGDEALLAIERELAEVLLRGTGALQSPPTAG